MVALKKAGDRAVGFGVERCIPECGLRDIGHRGAHIEPDSRDGPPRSQIFHGGRAVGPDPQRMKTSKEPARSPEPWDTSAGRRCDQLVGIGAEAFAEARTKRVLCVGQDPASVRIEPGAFPQGYIPRTDALRSMGSRLSLR